MSLTFTKMQGLGNDFVVIDGISTPVHLDAERVRQIADRRYGVGCDQVLVAEPALGTTADFRYRIWNRDGEEVEHCGNGVRCLARFLIDRGLAPAATITLETVSGLTRVTPTDEGLMQVDMGIPVLEPAAVPFQAEAPAPLYPLVVEGETVQLGVVSMGNPHAVLRVDAVTTAPVSRLGPVIEHHPAFPNRANVGFMAIMGRDHIQLRVYERGAGETLACGTGACAAVAVGIINGWLEPRVQVDLTGGQLVVHWPGKDQSLWMTGPAETVFDGRLPAGEA
ncbi:diaminopimelate epimerase [Spiribacter salinus M19-40]|uniref:Diaminopimelate epimerase n=1 Tax=Spiribacter salinus M19-40 TaxID=1260251 RepID=R4VHN1_9GAMM|nr:diaminopimelate epimerase [Spiribacter salinus]AGM40127.1 diaminopimelate epimerase [Spiribacter salinus M19-40]MBY5268641.1 diaminopimelate epimerase [Spiribacter salinus]